MDNAMVTAGPIQPVKARVRNRISHSTLSVEELDAKVEEFHRLEVEEQDCVMRQGRLLAEVKLRIGRMDRGGWGRFCGRIGITRRKADQYIFVAESKHADRMRGLGIAKVLLLAQHPDRAGKLLCRPEVVASMQVRDLAAKLRGKPVKNAKAATRTTGADSREDFADGQNRSALMIWAAGVLYLSPDAPATPGALVTAREHYAMLRQLLGSEYHGTLDEAIQTLEQGTTRMAVAA